MAFRKSLQEMLIQIYEASKGDPSTSPIFGQGPRVSPSPDRQKEWEFPAEQVRPDSSSSEERIGQEPTGPESHTRTIRERLPAAREITTSTETEAALIRERAARAEAAARSARKSRVEVAPRRTLPSHRTAVRASLLSRDGLQNALLLAEVIGPPRSIRGMADLENR
jgi:hypothetical protein